jgi:hypothetical protein
MQRLPALLVLLALLLIAVAPSLAAPPASGPATTAATSDEAFLATLGALPEGVQPIEPRPLSTFCVTNADCPTGQLCCYPCGIDGCSNICMKPVKGRCPLFV